MSNNFLPQIKNTPVSREFAFRDLYRLTTALSDFAYRYPQLAIHIDRAGFFIAAELYPESFCRKPDCRCGSFEKFHRDSESARSGNLLKKVPESPLYYALKAFAVCTLLRSAAEAFPNLAEICDRLVYEIQLALTNGADIESKTFAEFHADCQTARRLMPLGVG